HAIGDAVTQGVDQLHIADGPRALLDRVGHTVVPRVAAANLGRPFNGGAGADFLLPFWADGAEIAGEDERGPTAVSPVLRGDDAIRQLHVLVLQVLQRLVVPVRDFPHEDVGEDRTGELDRFADLGQVVDRYHGAHHERDMDHFAAGL